jgi:hypothetical protein
VLEEIVGLDRFRIIFDDDASGLWVERPGAKSRRSFGCGPRRSYYRTVMLRLHECLCANSHIPRMMVHEAQWFIDSVGSIPAIGL